VNIREALQETEDVPATDDIDIPASEANSMYDVTQSVKQGGVVLDAGREVRVKVYMGQVSSILYTTTPHSKLTPSS
jgi:phosphatidylinositol-3,4,5-trisphosphate 3-phosphatase/dual-specificity protein phosphatase PTEN